MAALSAASQKALAALRNFHPPPTSYPLLPLPRRAAVLILLFADRLGDLRVVLTIRSSNLKSYSGQAALPGGKADSLSETPFQTARREAWEEIGLPVRGAAGLPRGWSVEEVTELPCNLAMTELGVRPCVAFLHGRGDVQRELLPRLDAKEVAAVFTAPFHNFLRAADSEPRVGGSVPGEWYRGSWHSWHERAWRMHQFFVPVSAETVVLAGAGEGRREKRVGRVQGGSRFGGAGAEALPERSPSSSSLQPPLPKTFYANPVDALQRPRYRVFGMTARILVDCARVAYGEEPEFEHNSHFGDEEMIERLIKIGRLSPVRKEGQMLTREVMMEAARAKI